MKKVLAIVLTIYLSLIIFMPKEQLLYTGLNTLSKDRINFEIESVKDMLFYEDVDGMSVIYDKMRVARVENIKIVPFLLYNRVSISSIAPTGSLSSMLDVRVYSSTITYHIFNPLKANISADTSLGELEGEFDLQSSRIKLFLKPNKNFNNFKYKSYFKKQDGGYIYEAKI